VVAVSPNPSPVCPYVAAVSQTAGAIVIPGLAGKRTHVCKVFLVSATAQSVSITEGTGTTCGTGSAALAGSTTVANGVALAANGGWVEGNSSVITYTEKTIGDDVCLLQSGAASSLGRSPTPTGQTEGGPSHEKFLFAHCSLRRAAAFAQSQPQPSSTPASHFDAAQFVGTCVTTGCTITVTPPSGQYAYFTNIELQNCAGATTVTGASPTSITTTNLGGVAWTVGSGSTAAGQCNSPPPSGSFAGLLKSATAGTAVVFTLPAFATNQTIRLSVYYYFAP
jgi:hypothetical protein